MNSSVATAILSRSRARLVRETRKIHEETTWSHGFYRFCVPGSFQALIQYADMLAAQTAKFVSIHLTSLPLYPPPLCVLPLFHPSAISAPVVLLFLSFLSFFSFFSSSLVTYFLRRLQAGTAVMGDVVLPRNRSKFSAECLALRKYFPTRSSRRKPRRGA